MSTARISPGHWQINRESDGYSASFYSYKGEVLLSLADLYPTRSKAEREIKKIWNHLIVSCAQGGFTIQHKVDA